MPRPPIGWAVVCGCARDQASGGCHEGGAVAQYTYDAFGRTISQTDPLAHVFRHRFSTKYFDAETGLYYYGYRFYSPILRRWLNRDPIEERGGLNLYGFCGNNAIVEIDILGANTCCRGGKKVECDNFYRWNGAMSTISATYKCAGVVFIVIDLKSNFNCKTCSRLRFHAKAVLMTLSAGLLFSITGSDIEFGNVSPDDFVGSVGLMSIGASAMSGGEISRLRLGSATSVSAGAVGGGELGAGMSYGWYVDYDLAEE